MIYLDYRNVTPLLSSVLDNYISTTKNYMGSIYVGNKLGNEALKLYQEKTYQLAKSLDVTSDEIIYTSGLSEGLNIFFKSILSAREQLGKEIIVSKFENTLVYNILNRLSEYGYKIKYVECDADGIIDLNDLKSKINSSTTAVFISSISIDLGIRQPLKTIKQVVRKENPNTLVASDMSLSPGRIPINLNDVDVAIFSSSKMYGPKGVGFVYKRINIPMNYFRNDADYLPLITSMITSFKETTTNVSKKETKVNELYELLYDGLKDNPKVLFNRTKYSLSSIVNLAIHNTNFEELKDFLEKKDIIVSYAHENLGVSSLFNEPKRYNYNIIVSISHLTSKDEINKFCKLINIFLNK